MNIPVPPPVTRTDIAAWVIAAIALALVIELHLLSALLAGLLVFKLVDVLTPWLRLRALGRDGPRILAVTLIASAVIAALIGIGIGLVAFVRNSGESVPLLMQSMAQIIEDARAILPEGLRGYVPDDARDHAAHDRRMAAIERRLAAAGRTRHRPLTGARADRHGHRRAALDAEGIHASAAAPAHRANRPARRAPGLLVPARGVCAVLDLGDQHLLHVAVPRRGAAPVRCRPAAGEDPGGTDLRAGTAAHHRQPASPIPPSSLFASARAFRWRWPRWSTSW